jgi:lysozyme
MGLTAASGVVKPVAGMVITAAESRRLTNLALARNYEPDVAFAMPAARQHEFDAGVLFHWNTGAIGRASWVLLWVQRSFRPLIEAKYRQWNKGGGKVLPGLIKRRDCELLILFDAKYPVVTEPKSRSVNNVRWALPMDKAEKEEVIEQFTRLGYYVYESAVVSRAAEVRRFQSDHGLTADGIIGRATLSTLQRRIDAVAKAKPAAVVASGATATAAVPKGSSDITDWVAAQPWAITALLGGAALWGLYLAWQYRDVIAVKLNARAPKVAAFLRGL